MGFFDSWSDLVSAATPWSQAEAEAVSGGSSTEKTPAQKDDAGEGEAKVCLVLAFDFESTGEFK
jgi:ubiquinol-cytochrome c reductase subunit 6